jgi:hypothetical protein
MGYQTRKEIRGKEMKRNEIGHFPMIISYGVDSYPRRYLARDINGKNCITEDGQIKWENNWAIMGEVELVDIPQDAPFGELLIDLQTAHDCFCANEFEVNDVKYIALEGSGWAGVGFPFYDDTISEKDLYETGSGCYALIRGKARDEFIKLAKQNFIPSFKEVFTGDYKKDFCLPK